MNIRGFLVIGILWLGLLSGLHAQSYHKLWSLVEELEKKDMPKSIVEAANTIYVKAEKENKEARDHVRKDEQVIGIFHPD